MRSNPQEYGICSNSFHGFRSRATPASERTHGRVPVFACTSEMVNTIKPGQAICVAPYTQRNMGTWIKDSMTTGAVATVATTAAAAVLGQLENGNAAAPLNAVSHILWGESATRHEETDARHTLVGAGLNAAAVTGWAGVHELFMPRGTKPSLGRALLTGAAVSALAYITDYHVVPKRLAPGFEERLSGSGMLGMYATLGLALAFGSLSREP